MLTMGPVQGRLGGSESEPTTLRGEGSMNEKVGNQGEIAKRGPHTRSGQEKPVLLRIKSGKIHTYRLVRGAQGERK